MQHNLCKTVCHVLIYKGISGSCLFYYENITMLAVFCEVRTNLLLLSSLVTFPPQTQLTCNLCCLYYRLCTFGLWTNQKMMIFLWNCKELQIKRINWFYIWTIVLINLHVCVSCFHLGQSFILMMMLLRELRINLAWMIHQRFGLHLTIVTLSNLNRSLSDIGE